MARGSHATWGSYDSRVCIICGQPIRITKDAAWIHHDAAGHRSAHIACGTPLRTEATMTETPTTEPVVEPDPEPDPEPDGDDGEEADE